MNKYGIVSHVKKNEIVKEICKYCGKTIEIRECDKLEYCPFCGKKLDNPE